MVALMEENEQATIDTQPRWYTAGAPYLLTRDELVDELEKRQIHVTARQIRSWVSYGLLPKPIRRVPLGASDGIARALYPISTIGIIQKVLIGMSVGQSIEHLKQHVPVWIEQWDEEDKSFIPTLPRDPAKTAELERAAVEALRTYANHYAQGLGRTLVNAMSRMVFSDGTHHQIFVWPKPPWEEDEDST